MPTQPNPTQANDEPTQPNPIRPSVRSPPRHIRAIICSKCRQRHRFVYGAAHPPSLRRSTPTQPTFAHPSAKRAGYMPPFTPAASHSPSRPLANSCKPTEKPGRDLPRFLLRILSAPNLAHHPPSLAPYLFLRLCVRRALRPIPVLGYVVLRIPDSALSSSLPLSFLFTFPTPSPFPPPAPP